MKGFKLKRNLLVKVDDAGGLRCPALLVTYHRDWLYRVPESACRCLLSRQDVADRWSFPASSLDWTLESSLPGPFSLADFPGDLERRGYRVVDASCRADKRRTILRFLLATKDFAPRYQAATGEISSQWYVIRGVLDRVSRSSRATSATLYRHRSVSKPAALDLYCAARALTSRHSDSINRRPAAVPR